MNKQEEREYWTKLLADGPVWCEVWDDGYEQKASGLVVGTAYDCSIFFAIIASSKEIAMKQWESNDYIIDPWQYSTPILPKPRRPWTAEEIRVHGVFESKEGIVYSKVFASENSVFMPIVKDEFGRLIQVDIAEFCEQFRAVCLELRDGILCDTGKRVELYKDGE